MITAVFACSGALAALAGGLQALASGSGDPTAYHSVLIQAVTAALVGGVALSGGIGSVAGIVTGTLIVQTLSTGMTALSVPPYLTSVGLGGLLVVIVLVDVAQNRRSPWRPRVRDGALVVASPGRGR
ncbi:hypothetical protein GCM10023215_29700 [Pseudonocardia yuanmonensis]|uniref:Branched-chain amino acid transport system / permease component n=1 Tax=Pseudonocardia yuanmonensis TaxID=1095914 RepID=A0ABP8WJP6_9PSEU